MRGAETTAQSGDERSVHLRDYWRVAWQGKWIVLAVAVIIATLVGVATFLQTPIYRATARVQILPRAKSISPNADFTQIGASGWTWMAEERYINTQMEVIRSRELAQAVLEDAGLDALPEFSTLDDPAAALAGRVQLKKVLDTYVVDVSVEDADPDRAQLLANGFARVYVDSNARQAVGNAAAVLDELQQQLEPMQSRIADGEDERIALVRNSDYLGPQAQETSIDKRLNQLQNELTEVQIARSSREAVFNAIEEIERRGDSYSRLNAVAEDPLIRELTQQAGQLEKEIEGLALSFRETHPRVLEARAKLADVRRQLENETDKTISRVKTEYTIDLRREQDLKTQVSLLRNQGLDLSTTASQIARLDREIENQRRIYDLISSRIKEIELNQQTILNNVRVLQEAPRPGSPVRPRRTINLAAGIMLGLALGLGAVFFVDYLDNTIKSAEDIEQYLHMPLLAAVPSAKRGMSNAVKEAFQTLRTSILFASNGRTMKTVLVTSAGPGEGKSSTVTRLARTLALAGDRVLLIDADLRRPTVHMHLDVGRDSGLTNFLTGREGGDSWLGYLKQIADVPALQVLTCGPIPPNPAELFGSARFQEMLRDARERYDWVLIDSPPLALSDAVILASLVEMVVLVVKHNDNDRELIRRSVREIRRVEAHIVGAVLNDVDMRRAGYRNYYYSGYYSSPGDDADDPRASSKTPPPPQPRAKLLEPPA